MYVDSRSFSLEGVTRGVCSGFEIPLSVTGELGSKYLIIVNRHHKPSNVVSYVHTCTYIQVCTYVVLKSMPSQ